MIRISERSSRALSVMKMFSASESTQAITARGARDPRLDQHVVLGGAALDVTRRRRARADFPVERVVSRSRRTERRCSAQVTCDLAADAAVAADDVVV